MDILKASRDIHPLIIKWRRELHSIPGIDFDIVDTYNFIKDRLDEMGVEYKTLAGTGICALISGVSEGKTIAFRVDMDGLPINEETELPFASKNGCMHACGHDAHMAMLLGTAKILSENREYIKGNIKLIFQPAEENLGGAKPMIKDGCMKNPSVDRIFGLHIGQLFAEVGNGEIGIKFGPTMASVDKFVVKVKGKGGHGAIPHECVDPVAIAAEMIISLQRIISREINPLHPGVLSIGLINGGTAFNIIPDSVEFQGTVRTTSYQDREKIELRIKQMLEGIAKANNAEVEIDYIHRYPAIINDESSVKSLIEAAEKVVGKKNIIILQEPTMSSEDMSYYLQEAPGAYFFLGSSNKEKGIVYPHHHPKFDIDEDVLWIGPAVFTQIALDYFNS